MAVTSGSQVFGTSLTSTSSRTGTSMPYGWASQTHSAARTVVEAIYPLGMGDFRVKFTSEVGWFSGGGATPTTGQLWPRIKQG